MAILNHAFMGLVNNSLPRPLEHTLDALASLDQTPGLLDPIDHHNLDGSLIGEGVR